MYSNLIIPYQTIQIHPHFEIKNDENLLIKKDNTVDLITDTYKCKKDHLDINIKINIPSNLEFFVEEHENEKKALNCSVRIESRHSVIRKSVNLIREGNQFIGDIKIDLRNYVKEIILTPEIYRTKKLNKVKTYSLAVDKGSVIGFCDRPLKLNLEENPSTNFRVEWQHFDSKELNLHEAYHKNFYWLQIQDPRDNNPTLWLNKNYSKFDKSIFDTDLTKGLKFQNKKFFEKIIYHDVIGKLLIYVIAKLSKIQTEFDHDNKVSANTSPELISIDNLDYKWEQIIIKEFAKYLIPDTQNQEESLEALYHKIKDDPFDDLISSVELAVHLKKKSFNELEKYFDFVLEKEGE